VSFLLTAIGTLILLLSFAGIAFGVYMSTHSKSRESGKLFAIWWVPGLSAAWGIMLRDPVTFVIGLVCFLVAGITFFVHTNSSRKPSARRTRDMKRSSTRTTKENETRSRKAAS
jgi:hypothetical protein